MIARAVNSIGLGMIGGGSLEDALSELESGSADAVCGAGKRPASPRLCRAR